MRGKTKQLKLNNLKCPICKAKVGLQARIRRKIFFKLLPLSKSYKCYGCESQYVNWLSMNIPYKIKKRKRSFGFFCFTAKFNREKS